MEEKRYCIFCGTPLAENSDICPSCKKKLPVKEELFKEYLYRNTKDKLKGKADDALFAVVKNWLLSHLYGVVVSLMIIGLAVNAAAAPAVPSYIKKINTSYRPGLQETSQQQTSQDTENGITREDREEAEEVAHGFTFSIVYEAILKETEGEADMEDFGTPEQSSADYLLPSSYGGVTRNDYFYTNGYKKSGTHFDHDNITWNEPATDTGKRFQSEGYPVIEIPVYNHYGEARRDDLPAEKEDWFLFILVKADGQWYIAETRLLD